MLEEFCIVLGIVIAYWITYGTRFMAGEWSWRLPFLLQMVPGFVLIGGVMILPFSPRWLASKDRYEEALQSLSKLRRLPTTDKRVRQEFLDIQAEVRFHQEMNAEKHPHLQGGGLKDAFLLEMASWADCFKPGCWKRTHIGVGLMFFQQVSTQTSLLLWTSMANFQNVVCRYQCVDLLLSHSIRDHGLRLRHAAFNVRNPQRHTISRSYHHHLDHGQLGSTIPTAFWRIVDDYQPCDHRSPGRFILGQLARTPVAGLGLRCFAVGVYDCVRRQLGSSRLGHAFW